MDLERNENYYNNDLNNNNINIYYNHDINDNNSNDKTKSTADIISDSINNNEVLINQIDSNKLIDLISKEKHALSNLNLELSPSLRKPSFMEIKNNVQMIQHNIDNFFTLPGKKRKIKKEEDM